MNAIHPYGPTAAREHGKPGRELRPKSTTIDIHSHVGVPAAAALVKPHLDPASVPLAHFSTPETKAVNQRQEADVLLGHQPGRFLHGRLDGTGHRVLAHDLFATHGGPPCND